MGLFEKLDRRTADPEAMFDPQAYRDYAAGGASGLDKRLADEAAAGKP